MNENSKALIKKDKREIYFIIIVVLIILIDQIFKILICNKGNEINLISGILKFKITENRNGVYGIGSDSTIMYIMTNLIVLGVVFKFIRTQNQFVTTKMKIFLSFILAGGISNIIDKIFRNYVVEFVDFTEFIKIPVFNIADIFILIGWIGIISIFTVFTSKELNSKRIKDGQIKEMKNKEDKEGK